MPGRTLAGVAGCVFPCTHIPNALSHEVLKVIVKCVSPGILFPYLRCANLATTPLASYRAMHDVIRYSRLYSYLLSAPNINKGSPTVVKSRYTLVHTVCVALRCSVLPEIILMNSFQS